MGINGSLGTVLQGVSEQQPRVRLPGQVTAQNNMHSDPVRGLITRPPAIETGELGTDATPLKFDTIEIEGVKYIVGFRSGVLRVWTTAGSEFTVNIQDGDATNYVGDTLRFHVYDDTIYVSNPDVVVDEDSTVDTSDVMLRQGLVQCLGGSFGRNMRIKITYEDATVASGFYNLPDTDPDKVNGEDIMGELINTAPGALTTDGDLKGTTTLTLKNNVLLVTDTDFEFKITTEDGDDDKVLRSHTTLAKKIEDLVKWAPHGTLVKVEGEDKAADDFYMRFEVEEEETVGAGFGVKGLWREGVNAEEPLSLDFTTMPHVLFLSEGEFYFQRNLWESRRAGDQDSNPHPSFVGQAVADIGGFQSRLTFNAGANFVGSRTNFPFDFYAKSVVVESDSDPIDFASTTEKETKLKFQVPFDRDLLLTSKTHQFIVSGLTPLTPSNAAMVQTTDFEMAGEARPSSTGRTILFPYTIGTHAGLKEFFASDEIASNGADNLTQGITKYIDGEIIQIETSTNFEMTLIRTDHAASSKVMWVYKYLWDESEVKKVQSSWSKWSFPHDVVGMYWEGSKATVILLDGTNYILTTVDMDFDTHAVGYLPTLDRQTDEVADGSFQVSLAYDNAEFVQHTGCVMPGSRATETTKTGSGPYTYTFDSITVPSGATVIAGLPYVSDVTPTMPFTKTRDGKSKRLEAIIVTKFAVAFENSGYITATRTSKYRATDQVIDNNKFIETDDPDDVDQIGIRDGVFKIPHGERSDWSSLKLEALDIRPMTIMEIDWWGQRFTRGKRVT